MDSDLTGRHEGRQMTLTNDQIRALQAMADKATPGPWRSVAQGGHSTVLADVPVPSNDLRTAPFGYLSEMGHCLSHAFLDDNNKVRMDFTCFSHNNAAFIAASREAVPALCAELLAARAERDTLLAEVARLQGAVVEAVMENVSEVAKLREALEPFAALAARYDPPEGGDKFLVWGDALPTYGQLRRARAVLEPLQ